MRIAECCVEAGDRHSESYVEEMCKRVSVNEWIEYSLLVIGNVSGVYTE